MEKQRQLEEYLRTLGKVAIAYSGGIDSSYLLYLANKVLPKQNVIAIIANGIMVPRKDYKEAIDFLKENLIPFLIIKDLHKNVPKRNVPKRTLSIIFEYFTKK